MEQERLQHLRSACQHFTFGAVEATQTLIELADAIYEEFQDYEERLQHGETLDTDLVINSCVSLSRDIVRCLAETPDIGLVEVVATLGNHFGYDWVRRVLDEREAANAEEGEE